MLLHKVRDTTSGEEYPLAAHRQFPLEKALEALREDTSQELLEQFELKPSPFVEPPHLTLPTKEKPSGFSYFGQKTFPNSKFPLNGAEAIYLQRQKQVLEKGYTFEVDQQSYGSNPLSLLRAANAYLAAGSLIILQAPIAEPNSLVKEVVAQSLGWPFDVGYWKPFHGEFDPAFMDKAEMVQACLEKSGALQAAALDLFVDYEQQAYSLSQELPSSDPEFNHSVRFPNEQ